MHMQIGDLIELVREVYAQPVARANVPRRRGENAIENGADRRETRDRMGHHAALQARFQETVSAGEYGWLDQRFPDSVTVRFPGRKRQPRRYHSSASNT